MSAMELFYGTGGHGGPYSNVDHAIYRAVCLLRGNPSERFIEVRKGDFSTVVATVEKRDDGIYVVWPALSTGVGTIPAFDFKVSAGIGHTGLRFSTAEVLLMKVRASLLYNKHETYEEIKLRTLPKCFLCDTVAEFYMPYCGYVCRDHFNNAVLTAEENYANWQKLQGQGATVATQTPSANPARNRNTGNASSGKRSLR